MNALLATVTCPTCAGPLTWRQSTRPTALEASALLDYRARQAVMA